MKQFWMVWNPSGRMPMYKHPSEALAVEEAERLARLNASETFFVLEAIQVRRVDNMQRMDLRSPAETDDQIPF